MNYKLHLTGTFSIVIASIFDIITTTMCFNKDMTTSTVYEANMFLQNYIQDPFTHFTIKLVILVIIVILAIYIEKLTEKIKVIEGFEAPHVYILPYALISTFLSMAAINNYSLYLTNENIQLQFILIGFALLTFISLYITLIRPYQKKLSNLGE